MKRLARRLAAAIAGTPGLREGLGALGRAGLLPAAVRQRLPVTHEFRVSVPGGGSFRYHPVARDEMGRWLYWGGVFGREAETMRVFVDLARDARWFLDIGANTGIYTLVAAAVNPNLRAAAFEPVPRIFELLQTNLKINDLTSRCAARAEAVSDQPGTAELHVPLTDLPTSASLQSGVTSGGTECVQVPVIRIDDHFADQPIDLVKMDVEGFEDHALAGMERTLATHGPTIFVECLPDGPKERVESLLRAADYRIFHLRPEGPQEVAAIDPPPQSEKLWNYLAVRLPAALARLGLDAAGPAARIRSGG